MKRNNRTGRWVAHTPYDLIGWEATVIDQANEKGVFIVRAVKNDTKEVREVYADLNAIPLKTLERFSGRR